MSFDPEASRVERSTSYLLKTDLSFRHVSNAVGKDLIDSD